MATGVDTFEIALLPNLPLVPVPHPQPLPFLSIAKEKFVEDILQNVLVP